MSEKPRMEIDEALARLRAEVKASIEPILEWLFLRSTVRCICVYVAFSLFLMFLAVWAVTHP